MLVVARMSDRVLMSLGQVSSCSQWIDGWLWGLGIMERRAGLDVALVWSHESEIHPDFAAEPNLADSAMSQIPKSSWMIPTLPINLN